MTPAPEYAQRTTPGPAAELCAEVTAKQARLRSWMADEGFDALLLRRNENIAWATAGRVEARVLIPAETAVTSLLLTPKDAFYLAPNNEAARLAEEEFAGLGFAPLLHAWHEDSLPLVHRHARHGCIAADWPAAGAVAVNLSALRRPLQAGEKRRYRRLAAETARIVEDSLSQLAPGMTELQMQALVAAPLLERGILPSVLLMAADDRIRSYKHAVARGGRLDRFGMLNLCTRRWGLCVSITRFVHFGRMPQQLEDGFAVAAEVNAALLHGTRDGATSAELYAIAKEAYARAGMAGEEELHHQGGAAGYLEREWVATPTGKERIASPEAFAWNPSARGGKVEDTVLLDQGGIEVLTKTPSLPLVKTSQGGVEYHSAGVLIR